MDAFGNYKSVISARIADKAVLKKVQDGGIVTAAFVYGLENNLLDGAVVASVGEEFRAVPKVATTVEEILEAAGTKYTTCPNLSVLKQAIREYGCEKVGVVGTPCQIIATRKSLKYPVGFRHMNDKIALTVGIFCMENFPYNGMKTIVEEHCGVKMDDVAKLDIGKGKFWTYTKWGETKSIKLADTHPYEQIACHVCTDYTAELADISTGSVGSPDGWSTVFARTEKGEEFLNGMVESGYLETKPVNEGKFGLELLAKLANIKKSKNQKEIDHRKEIGLPVPY
ncbi:coenzyme F420 hydrogenase subunit beta [Methanococcus aeolicus]|jgi:coenzyme F420 hydrogenase subunit beta|uniref:Coenzyme F420 hydrogenase subunit beta n=1 Tax=Methanococcus aeolicus (strain ATCC BAA-1280 / DSM 17508 / OCM 812 / Nankai-3) TaxID=419665 RepID=A6UVU8_META3|nr:coenzyme F420 hydrogenase subunit beta [Methanococcus aeolicus]ABR56620.1 coenzyme F420 hydrogenase/dehydrogenase beta subunit domain protein [Methanococcus aeolicus Nankai-3]UXM84624.1 coenzyme F420 hydrogenase subunit beta [Methanococcus aeolicus]